MQTFVMLTRLSPDAVLSASHLKDLEKSVAARVESECPSVKWIGSYAILGPCDYLDIFEAPDSKEATKVSLLVRTLGHASTEIWTATEWDRFKSILSDLPRD